MKKTTILIVCLFFAATSLMAQTKAGRVDTAQHVTLYSCPMHLEVQSHEPGKCPKCNMDLALSTKEKMKAEVMKTYTCPMHPDVALDKDGKCPKCGKDLVEKKQNR